MSKLRLLSLALMALALAGCSGGSKEETAGPPKVENVPNIETQEGRKPQTAAPLDEKQAKLVAAIEQQGGKVQFDENAPGRPICAIDFSNSKISDEGLANLDRLPQLKVLTLSGTKVTDAGLRTSRGCKC